MPVHPDQALEPKFDAKKFAETVCTGLAPMTNHCDSKYLHHRLIQAVNQGIQSLSYPLKPLSPVFYLSSFKFNDHEPLHKRLNSEFYIEWGMGNNIVVQVPAIRPLDQIVPAPRTKSVNLKIGAINITTSNSVLTNSHFTTIPIPYDDFLFQQRTVVLPVASHPHSISLVVAGLEYIASHNKKLYPVLNKKWQSVDVLDAAYFLN